MPPSTSSAATRRCAARSARRASAAGTGCPSRLRPSRACRVVVAARIDHPGSEWLVFRTLQLANFNTALLLDDDRQLAEALREVPGIDSERLVARIDDPDVVEAYERDRAE